MHSRITLNVMMPVFFKILVLVQVSLALGGVGCGIWAWAAGKPLAVAVIAASAVAAVSGLVFVALLPRLHEPCGAAAES